MNENTKQILETEMKAVEITYIKKRLAKKEALVHHLPTKTQASITSDQTSAPQPPLPVQTSAPQPSIPVQTSAPQPSLPVQTSAPQPLPDASERNVPTLEEGEVASVDICSTIQPRHIGPLLQMDRKRDFSATQDNDQHVTGGLATDVATKYSKRWARASAVPAPKHAILSHGNTRWVRASSAVPKKLGKNTLECSGESALLSTMSTTQDTCDIAAMPERCLNDDSVDGRGYAGDDMDDKGVADDIEMQVIVDIDTEHRITTQSNTTQSTKDSFRHATAKPRQGYGKGPLRFFVGGNRVTSSKGLYMSRQVALQQDACDPSSAPVPTKTVPLTHREKALAALTKELATSACFVNQPKYARQ